MPVGPGLGANSIIAIDKKNKTKDRNVKKRILAFSMVLALTAVMALPMAAAAETSGTIISGTLASTATIVAPSGITFVGFAVGVNSGNSATPGSVAANGPGWTLTVSAPTTCMTRTGDSAELNHPLTLCTTSGGTFGTIGDYRTSLQGSTGYGTSTSFSIPLFVKQTVLASDAPGTYSITLTYTVTPAS